MLHFHPKSLPGIKRHPWGECESQDRRATPSGHLCLCEGSITGRSAVSQGGKMVKTHANVLKRLVSKSDQPSSGPCMSPCVHDLVIQKFFARSFCQPFSSLAPLMQQRGALPSKVTHESKSMQSIALIYYF